MSFFTKQGAALEHREIVEVIKNHWFKSKTTADEDALSLRLKFDAWLKLTFADDEQQTVDRLKARFHAALDEALSTYVNPRALILYIPSLPQRISPLGASITIMPSPADWWRSFAITAVVFLTMAGLVSSLGTASAYDRDVFRLTKFTSVATDSSNAFQRGSDGKSLRVTSRAARPTTDGRTGGVSLQLPLESEHAVSGKVIEVTVEVEPLASNAAGEFAVAYSTAAVGDSGWRKFDLAEGERVFSFRYQVPEQTDDHSPAKDFIGIWADTNGSGAGVLVTDVSVKIVRRL
ncbi:MAG: hypothetical protein AAFP80_08050 [Pseudomonadota bacterium]